METDYTIHEDPKKLEYNILRKKHVELFNKQPKEIQKKILDLQNRNYQKGEYNLKQITEETKKTNINEGDIFLFSPESDIYFYGKVLKCNINNPHYVRFKDGKPPQPSRRIHMLVFFKCKTKSLNLNDYKLDYNNIFGDGFIITNDGFWRAGGFCTIGNIPLTDEENNLDYGFLETLRRLPLEERCSTEEGVILNRVPKILSERGLTTMYGICQIIYKDLIIEPFLLNFDK